MILHGNLTINGKKYRKGDYVSAWSVYPFFLLHMLFMGFFVFHDAYFRGPTEEISYFGDVFIIGIYLFFYIPIFGIDEVKWLIKNSLVGMFGVYAEVDILLSYFNKNISEFPFYVHIFPFLFYSLYTFLFRQIFIDITYSRGNKKRTEIVSYIYLFLSLAIYSFLFFK